MSCGCGNATACGCTIVGGTNINVQQIGSDTFVINGELIPDPSPQNVFIQTTDPGPLPYAYVWWQVDGGGDVVTEWISP